MAKRLLSNMVALPLVGSGPLVGAQQLLQAIGRLNLSCVDEVGTAFGPANDRLDAEVVIRFQGRAPSPPSHPRIAGQLLPETLTI